MSSLRRPRLSESRENKNTGKPDPVALKKRPISAKMPIKATQQDLKQTQRKKKLQPSQQKLLPTHSMKLTSKLEAMQTLNSAARKNQADASNRYFYSQTSN